MKKWFKRLVQLVLTLIILAVLAVFVDQWYAAKSGKAQVLEIYNRLDRDEPGWRLVPIVDKWNSNLPEDESNAAMVALKGARELPENHFYWRDKLEQFHSSDQFPLNILPNTENMPDLVEVKTMLENSKEALNQMNKCRQFPAGGFPVVMLEENGGIHTISQSDFMLRGGFILPWRAYFAAMDNQPAAVIEDYRTILHLRKNIGGEPGYSAQRKRMFLMTSAVTTLERTLALTEIKSELPALQNELETLTDDRPNHIAGIEGERAMRDEIFKMSIATQGGAVNQGGSIWEKIPIRHMSKRNVHYDHAFVLDLITQTRDAMKLTGQERLKAIQKLPGRGSISLFHIHAREFIFPNDAIIAAELKSEALIHSAIVAIACERHRLETGSWPKQLSDITQKILKSRPADPISGKELIYKTTETGIEIYSVGRNGKDEGGVTAKYSDDTGFRLFDAKIRRQKPIVPMDEE